MSMEEYGFTHLFDNYWAGDGVIAQATEHGISFWEVA